MQLQGHQVTIEFGTEELVQRIRYSSRDDLDDLWIGNSSRKITHDSIPPESELLITGHQIKCGPQLISGLIQTHPSIIDLQTGLLELRAQFLSNHLQLFKGLRHLKVCIGNISGHNLKGETAGVFILTDQPDQPVLNLAVSITDSNPFFLSQSHFCFSLQHLQSRSAAHVKAGNILLQEGLGCIQSGVLHPDGLNSKPQVPVLILDLKDHFNGATLELLLADFQIGAADFDLIVGRNSPKTLQEVLSEENIKTGIDSRYEVGKETGCPPPASQEADLKRGAG